MHLFIYLSLCCKLYIYFFHESDMLSFVLPKINKIHTCAETVRSRFSSGNRFQRTCVCCVCACVWFHPHRFCWSSDSTTPAIRKARPFVFVECWNRQVTTVQSARHRKSGANICFYDFFFPKITNNYSVSLTRPGLNDGPRETSLRCKTETSFIIHIVFIMIATKKKRWQIRICFCTYNGTFLTS